jgi:tRNA U34 5-methylaminomethyl-2-thiouridine-forming methyltransferase MnmC
LLELVKTNDGSSTLYNPQLKEHYHSTHGALTESMHVFINNGLLALSKERVRILEIGFGTGLNAILTYETALIKNITIEYTGLELYPLDSNTIAMLNYQSIIKPGIIDIFNTMHLISWNMKVALSPFFFLEKVNADLTNYEFTEKFDLVYFDAFGPDVQPEIWSYENFKKIYNSLNTEGLLVTYSSKGTVKENLRKAGFEVKRLQGPPGKRHMIQAIKQ